MGRYLSRARVAPLQMTWQDHSLIASKRMVDSKRRSHTQAFLRPSVS